MPLVEGGKEETKANEANQNQNTTKDSRQSVLKEDEHPNEDSSSVPAKQTPSQQFASIESVNFDSPAETRSLLMQPCPKGDGTIQCCIKRNKGIKNALFPEYRIYLKSNNSNTETFLMTSKKRGGNKTSNYLISMSRNDHDKNSDGCLL